jgi:hypothetical protein
MARLLYRLVSGYDLPALHLRTDQSAGWKMRVEYSEFPSVVFGLVLVVPITHRFIAGQTADGRIRGFAGNQSDQEIAGGVFATVQNRASSPRGALGQPIETNPYCPHRLRPRGDYVGDRPAPPTLRS